MLASADSFSKHAHEVSHSSVFSWVFSTIEKFSCEVPSLFFRLISTSLEREIRGGLVE